MVEPEEEILHSSVNSRAITTQNNKAYWPELENALMKEFREQRANKELGGVEQWPIWMRRRLITWAVGNAWKGVII